MKKILVLGIICMLQMGVVSAINNNRVEMLPSSYDDSMAHNHPKDRENDWIPQVNLEDNQLSFESSDSPIIIYVYRGDRKVYAQMVAGGCTSVVLPSYLKGDFTLYLAYGDTVYYGEINL